MRQFYNAIVSLAIRIYAAHPSSTHLCLLQLYSLVTFQSVGYISSSWVPPASRLWVGGELTLHQRVPFPPSGRLERYNVSVLDADQVIADEFEFRNILSRQNERNGECLFKLINHLQDYGHRCVRKLAVVYLTTLTNQGHPLRVKFYHFTTILLS